jgi:hypothetical protein
MVAGSASMLPWCKVKPQVEQTLLHGINKFLLTPLLKHKNQM